ncbi:MAG: Fic family protein [Luteolibacter sp.]
MNPPFSITPETLRFVSEIERLIGRIEGVQQPKPQPHLRKANRVRTIQGSLAIEGNKLDLDQVTALLDGKRVIGRKEEIQEALNAIATYDLMARFDPFSSESLLQAHRLMMDQLIPSPGKWRTTNVGILKGSKVSHIAPKADRVPHLMDDLFRFLRTEDFNPLIRSCVFHYELEFIHPFHDGNGRIGRFWQTLLLYHYHPVFEFIPIESLIREHQQEYYAALEASDRSGDSTAFITFSLGVILQSLEDFFASFSPKPLTATQRLSRAREHFVSKDFSRKLYLELFKTISTATASRDLKQATEEGILSRFGKKSLTLYRFRFR